MRWLSRLRKRLSAKREAQALVAVAEFEQMTDAARAELDRQRAGIARESQKRRRLKSQLERDILAATRDVLSRKPREQKS